MTGFNLPALASAFVHFLQRENRRPSFARRHRLRRRHHGARFRRFGRGAGFRRHGNGSGLRHRSRLGGRRRPFTLNRRRHGSHRHGYPCQAPVPPAGQGAQESVADAARPSAPLRSAFSIPPMDWLLGGPAAPFLGEEDDFDAALAPPPPGIFFNDSMDGVAFCPAHGYGPCPARDGVLLPPAPATPPPEQHAIDALHTYPDLEWPPPAVLGFDLNAMAEAEDEEMPVVALASPPASPPPAPPALAAPSPPSPTPEARRLLRQFAAAMARHNSSARTGTWSPAALGFSNEAPGPGESSSSAGQPRA
uniref:Uncharacterized protein n=1 Tax=Avena sativa TaxID=4498 RepID=A0ACD5TXM7_AVESA